MTDPSRSLVRPAPSGPDVLRLARRDRDAACESLRALGVETQAQVCLQLRPEVRSEFLMLLDHPESIVPLLPDAEVCMTICAAGMSEAAWLLEMATPPQLRACFDLDCWNGDEVDLVRSREWIDALIEAGRPTLLRGLQELDLELWLLTLRADAEITIVGKEDIPPDDAQTIDGVVYFKSADDAAFARVREIAGASFSEAQEDYWRLVYGMIFESPAECEEYALRWRTGRLLDLGFPDREQAMRVYRPLIAKSTSAWDVLSGEGGDLVPSFELPERIRGSLLGRSLAELPPARAAGILGYVLSVANAIAVADRLRLSDSDSIPQALDKAVRGIEGGLRELASVRDRAAHEVLDETLPLDLFRIGATLDRALRRR